MSSAWKSPSTLRTQGPVAKLVPDGERQQLCPRLLQRMSNSVSQNTVSREDESRLGGIGMSGAGRRRQRACPADAWMTHADCPEATKQATLTGTPGWPHHARNLTPLLTPARADWGRTGGRGGRRFDDFPQQTERTASSGHGPVALLICGLRVRFPPGSPSFHQHSRTAPSS
jgi:hypothetical protein